MSFALLWVVTTYLSSNGKVTLFPVNNVQASHQPKMLRVIHQMITRMQMVMMTGRLLRAL